MTDQDLLELYKQFRRECEEAIGDRIGKVDQHLKFADGLINNTNRMVIAARLQIKGGKQLTLFIRELNKQVKKLKRGEFSWVDFHAYVVVLKQAVSTYEAINHYDSTISRLESTFKHKDRVHLKLVLTSEIQHLISIQKKYGFSSRKPKIFSQTEIAYLIGHEYFKAYDKIPKSKANKRSTEKSPYDRACSIAVKFIRAYFLLTFRTEYKFSIGPKAKILALHRIEKTFFRSPLEKFVESHNARSLVKKDAKDGKKAHRLSEKV